MTASCSAWSRVAGFTLLLGFAALLTASTALAQSGTPRSASDATPTGDQVGYLLADKVFVEPSTSSAAVVSLTRDDRVRVTPAPGKEGWYEVYRVGESERAGYAFEPYVSRFGSQGLTSYASGGTSSGDGDPSDEPLSEVVFAATPDDVGVLYTVGTWANVRVGPGTDHRAFGVIRPDVPFQVLGVERGWGRIRLEGEPSVGYVSASLLHRQPVSESVAAEPVAAEPTPSQSAATEDPVRQAVTGRGVAGGGVPDAPAADTEGSQEEALREALSEVGVDSEATVYVTRTGRKFHREGCRHLRSRTFAIPLAEAMMDYSPCRSCKPLQPSGESGE